LGMLEKAVGLKKACFIKGTSSQTPVIHPN